MGFVSFFTTGRSYASPYFILMVPVGVMGYYLLWENGCVLVIKNTISGATVTKV